MKDPRPIAILASSALVLLLGVLMVQHLRHGWPFSLHHGIGAPPPAAVQASRSSAADMPAHPRVEVELDPTQMETSGIRMAKVQEETITQTIRSVATVVPDESRVSHVHTRVSGWIEQLFVNTTGEVVREGQPLAAIFSQELLSSQTEFLASRRAAASERRSVVTEGARARLGVLGMTEEEIRAIEQTDEPRRLVTVTAPRSGIVLHRGISVGTAVDPSTEIVTVADLSQVWVIAEVSEGNIPDVQVGTTAVLEFPAAGKRDIESQVEFLYPTLSERTRTLRVRFAVGNPDESLRPGIYGSATFRVAPRPALTVPRDAIVDTGNVQHVFLLAGNHRFVPRPVKLGARLGERVEVREGLAAGADIVASGVFLIDSESRLRASGGGTGHAHGASEQTKEKEKSPSSHESHAPSTK
jgi:membrane fusion protein, copper/silver efflux system